MFKENFISGISTETVKKYLTLLTNTTYTYFNLETICPMLNNLQLYSHNKTIVYKPADFTHRIVQIPNGNQR